MQSDQRLIIAMVLAMVVLYIYYGYIMPHPDPQQTPPTTTEQTASAPTLHDEPGDTEPGNGRHPMLPQKAEKQAETAKTEAPAEGEVAENTQEPGTAEVMIAPEKAVPEKAHHEPVEVPESIDKIETEDFIAEFTNHGASIHSFRLKSPKFQQVDAEGRTSMLDLVSLTQREFLPGFLSFHEANFRFPADADFEVVEAGDKSIIYRYVTPEGLRIEKTFTHTEGFMFDLTVTVSNESGGVAAVSPRLSLAGYEDEATLKSMGMFGGPAFNMQIPKSLVDDEVWDETDKKARAEKGGLVKGKVGWFAIDRRFFMMAIVPPEVERSQVNVSSRLESYQNASGDEKTREWMKLFHTLPERELQAGQSAKFAYHAYFGPKYYTELTDVGYELDRAVDFGWFKVLAIPMLWVLKFSQQVVINWGIAIILLTILVKILIHPLTKKSFESMQRMKDLKPKIDELNEKFKDDPQKKNQEMMALYKKEGVNPLGGCLPLLLQMPMFIALYQMLANSVELYNSPFIPGWINSLTDKDPYYIMPVALAVLMFLQQKLSPQAMDSQQQKMMMWMMPVMMLFFMAWLPSGLVLYILANTVMAVGQQWWIAKQSEKKAALAAGNAKG